MVLTHAHRTIDRARAAHLEGEALAEGDGLARRQGAAHARRRDRRSSALHLTEFAEGLDLGIVGWGTAQGNAAELASRTRELAGSGFRIVLSGRGHGSLERAGEVIGEGVRVEPVESPLADGFMFRAGRLAVVTEEDLFGSRRPTRTAPRSTRRRTDAIAEELEPGDYAVHRIHGVGWYTASPTASLPAPSVTPRARVRGGDKLFVPSDAVGMVAKYVGGDSPRLHRMGGSDWARATAKVKRAMQDMAGELGAPVHGAPVGPRSRVRRRHTVAAGARGRLPPRGDQRPDLGDLDEVKADLLPEPMDRLVCGDVGFGKTEIAVRAAFKAVMDRKQVAVLVPTTTLAEQHFITFSERFAPFPVTVKMLSRFVSHAEQKQVVEDVKAGKVDVVIGTHRLLGKDVAFRDLGLLVVDEEQRFGVAHKERLKQSQGERRRPHAHRDPDPAHARDGGSPASAR